MIHIKKDINKNSGKYIGYYTAIEGSTILWNDDIEELKKHWCFGYAIFESNGLIGEDIKALFSKPPERGVILDYFIENLPFVLQEGTMIGKTQPKRVVIIEKTKK